MQRDKRERFYTIPFLTEQDYLENERLVNQIMQEKGIVYAPPKVKLVKKDATTFHLWPCECHPNIVTKENI